MSNVIFYIFAVSVAVLTAFGQLFFKKTAIKDKKGLAKIIDFHFILGGFCFAIAPFLSILSMRKLDYSVFYSFNALVYIVVVLISKFILNERIDKSKIIGVSVIFIGLLVFNYA